MAARDGEEMVESRLLEIVDRRLVQAAVLAEEKRLEHGAGRGDVLPIGRRERPLERGLDAPADARDPAPERGPGRGDEGDEQRGLRRASTVDPEALKIALVREGPEVPERATAREADRGPYEVAGH